MKRISVILFALILLCSAAVSFAENDTWICTSCGKESTGIFCAWCGSKKTTGKSVCPSCGEEYDSDAGYAFCGNCGASLTGKTSQDKSDNPSGEKPIIRWETDRDQITVGDKAFFGHYEQDNNPDNGPETIEWIVLDIQDGKVLLKSRYILDTKPYNEQRKTVSWEECTLRSWLNGEFMNAAFTSEEQKAILTAEVDNGAGQSTAEWKTRPGANTRDQIFLLSHREAAEQYYSNNESRRCAPTAYAVKTGVLTSDEYRTGDGELAGFWWLRSPYLGSDYSACFVYDDGDTLIASDVTDNMTGVSPVLWIQWPD